MPCGIPENVKLTLASRSPRRQQLLKEAGLDFGIIIRDYAEDVPEGLPGKEIAEHLAREKALQFRADEIAEDEVIITADTVVWCSGKVLGKPLTTAEAFGILREISGKTHEVITGVSLRSRNSLHTFSEVTRVTFDELSVEDIAFYTENYKPFDKAGAYGIQEWIGIVGNSHIEGSYFNVMGLPVNRLLRELKIFIGNHIKP